MHFHSKVAKAEKVFLAKGRVDIQATPDEFPLGARGARPVRFTLFDENDMAAVKTLTIPGVIARGMRVDCAWDAAPIIAAVIGEPNALDAALNARLTCKVPIPGKETYDQLGLQKVRREYQGEGSRFLLRRAYAILGDPPRAGKCLMILIVCVLIDVKKVLIICNSLGKYVWAEEIAKWLGEECALLFGRAGHEVRIFCRACLGRGSLLVNDGVTSECAETPCKTCWKRGRSYGEHIVTVRILEQETVPRVYNDEPTPEAMAKYDEKCRAWTAKVELKQRDFYAKEQVRFAKWEKKDPRRRKPFKPKEPPKYPGTLPEKPKGQRRVERVPVDGVFRCPKHREETSDHARPCSVCRAELLTLIDSKRFIIVNYDILSAQKDKDDVGTAYVRTDLPGWGPILARYKFEMALADESHKLRGWQGKGAGSKDATTRRERANEVCAEIPRVYAVTGTPVYGFTRDLWGQLDYVSKGLWS